jgi:hypothetical protein
VRHAASSTNCDMCIIGSPYQQTGVTGSIASRLKTHFLLVLLRFILSDHLAN